MKRSRGREGGRGKLFFVQNNGCLRAVFVYASDINKRREQAKEGGKEEEHFYPKNVLFPQIPPTEVIIIGILQTSFVA